MTDDFSEIICHQIKGEFYKKEKENIPLDILERIAMQL